MPMPLIITPATPSFVHRARLVVRQEYEMDLAALPDEDWKAILLVALEHERRDTFRAAVCRIAEQIACRRFNEEMHRL